MRLTITTNLPIQHGSQTYKYGSVVRDETFKPPASIQQQRELRSAVIQRRIVRLRHRSERAR